MRDGYQIEVLVIETADLCSDGTKNIHCIIGRNLTEVLGDHRETLLLMQGSNMGKQCDKETSIACVESER